MPHVPIAVFAKIDGEKEFYKIFLCKINSVRVKTQTEFILLQFADDSVFCFFLILNIKKKLPILQESETKKYNV